ncbi:riboflavin deaminase [Agrobacterium larrymoorei]|uniref:RibD family protein n=1 Tax=Agrobacterium larrymoorei TaxID=160699 RepID=UPI001574C186|nr:dihydrofolate reductase family protein [Agrobacterium larrymoorei]NTJ43925.1 riboflavin deaminase [Agrobacterium larrymoorei]
MRNIHMSETLWTRLLSVRNGQKLQENETDSAILLYGPIASARKSFVLAQVGQSLDGRVATPAGDARDISGPDGIAHLHRCRALVDAVIVGVGTVKNDDPRLSVREVAGPSPVRVVIDCRGELTGTESLFHDNGMPVIVIQGNDAPVRQYNAETVRLCRGESGIDPKDILACLEERGLAKLLVEGGARTISRFIEADLVDHLHVAIAPLIIGSGPSGITLPPISELCNAHRPAAEVYTLGTDILFDCRLKAETASTARKGEQVRVTDSADAAFHAYV